MKRYAGITRSVHFSSILHWIKAKQGLHREPTTQSINQSSKNNNHKKETKTNKRFYIYLELMVFNSYSTLLVVLEKKLASLSGSHGKAWRIIDALAFTST